MKIVTLMENTACREDLQAEHGLSLYLEIGERKLLFDMGQSAAFSKNAAALGVDLTQVDTAVLSHGHYDHGGGLETFLRINDRANIYVNQNVFEPHYNGIEKYIGLARELESHPRILRASEGQSLGPGLTLCSCHNRDCVAPIDPAGLTVLRDGERFPEDFRHEQYLLVEEQGKRILLSGCSHRGILNIVSAFRPDMLIGGFHFMKLPERAAAAAAERLLEFPTTYYTCHCTGLAQYAAMKAVMGDRLSYLAAGSVLEL